MIENILSADPLSPTTVGDGFQKVNVHFSEQWHLAYQIKLNYECSNMLANILPAEPTPDPGVGFKGQNPFFQNMVMLHIK